MITHEIIGDDMQAVIVTLDPREMVMAEAGAMIATENVGTIMIIASIFDAITDPVMGFASDRFRTR